MNIVYMLKRYLKNLNKKKPSEYHDLYVQSDTLLLADVFENFRNKCIEINELDSATFLSAPGLVWQVCLKKTGIKLKLLTDNDVLMMVEKGIRGGIPHVVYSIPKQIINTWKILIKTKNYHIFSI